MKEEFIRDRLKVSIISTRHSRAMRHLMLLFPLLLAACTGTPEAAPEESSTPALTAYVPLQDTLDARKAAFEARADAEKKRVYAEGIEAVRTSGILQAARQVGDTAPDFTLGNATGRPVRLYEVLEQGPVVLTWYRGGWCPYCNLTLHRLQQELPNFRAAGATLLALTPELPDSSLSTAEKNALEFDVLSDPGNTVARSYGVVFELTPEVAASYQQSFDLHGYNGDASNELPLAATYVIGTDGVITYAFLHPDYRNRAEPREILEALEGM